MKDCRGNISLAQALAKNSTNAIIHYIQKYPSQELMQAAFSGATDVIVDKPFQNRNLALTLLKHQGFKLTEKIAVDVADLARQEIIDQNQKKQRSTMIFEEIKKKYPDIEEKLREKDEENLVKEISGYLNSYSVNWSKLMKALDKTSQILSFQSFYQEKMKEAFDKASIIKNFQFMSEEFILRAFNKGYQPENPLKLADLAAERLGILEELRSKNIIELLIKKYDWESNKIYRIYPNLNLYILSCVKPSEKTMTLFNIQQDIDKEEFSVNLGNLMLKIISTMGTDEKKDLVFIDLVLNPLWDLMSSKINKTTQVKVFAERLALQCPPNEYYRNLCETENLLERKKFLINKDRFEQALEPSSLLNLVIRRQWIQEYASVNFSSLDDTREDSPMRYVGKKTNLSRILSLLCGF